MTGEPLNLLILEDHEPDALLMAHELERFGFVPEWRRVDTEAGFLAALADPPTVILADMTMPGFDAMRALEVLREQGLDVPLIIVSGTVGDESGVECMRAGAADYLQKDRLARLGAAVRHALEQRRLSEELREAHERFRGAFNHAATGMALCDIDGRFSAVNPALAKMLGRTDSELLRTDIYTVTHASDQADLRSGLSDIATAGTQAFHDELRLLHEDGSVVWVSLSASGVSDRHAAPLYFVVQAQDVSNRARAESRVRFLSDHDPVTGMHSRGSLVRLLNEHIAREPAMMMGGAVAVIEVEGPKGVIDALGHVAGDAVVVEIAHALRVELGWDDAIARVDTAEFVLLMPRASADVAHERCAAALAAIRSSNIAVNDLQVNLSAHAGVALIEAGYDADELMLHAGRAMDAARARGGGAVVVSTVQERRRRPVVTRLTQESRLRDALNNDRFVLLWQPILDLARDEISQYELLLRLLGDDGELMRPHLFLPVAERLGMITEIDLWVMRNAIQLLADSAVVGPEIVLEVNLSGHSVVDPALPGLIERELDATGVDPRRLVFEVTETAAITNIDEARRCVRAVTDLGCRFALDDFGVGFCSFYYLKHLPVEFVKIDGDFIRELADRPDDRLLVRAIAEIARGLGKQTIAEFVETDSALELLRDFGVDYAQGYLIGVPGPAPGRPAAQAIGSLK